MPGLATVALAYMFFSSRSGSKGAEGDPTWAVPDLFGEYDKAQRKKVSASFLPPPLGPVPPQLLTKLNKPLRVGDLEVEPLGVKLGKPTILNRGEGKVPTVKSEVLELELRVTNKSKDTEFYPNDPAFQRFSNANRGTKPFNSVNVGARTEFGGLLAWPAQGQLYYAGQEDDNKPLGPGESRTTIVTSASSAPYTWLNGGAKGLWRVQLRRGLVEAKGRDVSVSTVIGVEFSADDVKTGS